MNGHRTTHSNGCLRRTNGHAHHDGYQNGHTNGTVNGVLDRIKAGEVIRLFNCRLLRNGQFVNDDLWIESGRVICPQQLFYDDMQLADREIDCQGFIVAPGYIDLQINGGFGYDFSRPGEMGVEHAVNVVAERILQHGVTAFCPTLVTLPRKSYHSILPQISTLKASSSVRKKSKPKILNNATLNGTNGVANGGASNGQLTGRQHKLSATVLGVHLEGPFINGCKRGAHPKEHIKDNDVQYYEDIIQFYGGSLNNVSIVTLAPELDPSGEVIKGLVNDGILVSLGHSCASLADGERAVQSGATFITHLFNAMLPFHHRDPGLVGLLASDKTSSNPIFYGIIADGVHTHAAAVNIAYRTNPEGLVLVTDAMAAMGLDAGRTHTIGTQEVQIEDGNKAYISGTETLAGAVLPMDQCVRTFKDMTKCSVEEAINCATLHPARALKIDKERGTLHIGSQADFILLDDSLQVYATYIAGKCLYKRQHNGLPVNKSSFNQV